MPNLIYRDKAADGKLISPTSAESGTVDYATGEVILSPFALVPVKIPQYEREIVGTRTEGNQTITEWREVLIGFEEVLGGYLYESGDVTATYLPASATGSMASETFTLDALETDLTLGYGEQITRGSARFKLGNSTFVDVAGQIYRDPSPETGAGSLAGSLDPTTGRVRLTQWVADGANAVTLEALTTQVGVHPIDAVTFRTPVSPLKPGTLQLRWSDLAGAAYSKSVGSTGKLTDADCQIDVDFERGVVRAHFGRWYEIEDLTPEQIAEPWYDPERVVIVEEVEKIWRANLINAETLIYNAVASAYLPPDSELLGLDAARLPPDGKALIYTVGKLALTHHTDSVAVSTLSPTQEIDCGRTRLYRVVIEDADGKRLPADQYTLNRELGIVTMGASLNLNGFAAPWAVKHTVADLARIVSTDINGTLTMMSALSHAYPADESYCSGVLFAGTLQARVSNLFAQSSWTNEWSDTRIGAAPLAQYNDALYPVLVANEGAYPDRFLIKFTSATAFQVIGENLGLIGIGSINEDCEPINSLTELPYFKIDYRGWGAGWATGNCLRFNLHAASFPVDLVRAVQPSQPTGLADSVELLLIGNTDNTGA